MYLFPVLLALLILLLFHVRKKHIINKINSMPPIDKVCKLNQLIYPYGFEYILSQDIFISCGDAWQKDYGYCRLYDLSAPHFNMVFDCEPVYFDYAGCTWLLEFWKGQYGINLGVEIGIYKADRILKESERDHTLFHAISDEEMPDFFMQVSKDCVPVFQISRKHWWLAAFSMGRYTKPEQLTADFTITFPTPDMRDAFIGGLLKLGYGQRHLSACSCSVTFTFDEPLTRQPRTSRRFLSAFAQWKNRLFLKLYCRATRPFCYTMDKLLYLYGYLPFAFRHMICIQKKKPKRIKRRKH